MYVKRYFLDFDGVYLLTYSSSDTAAARNEDVIGNNVYFATFYQPVQHAFDTPATQMARMSVHSIHPITNATTLTLEVQGSQAQALQGIKNRGRYIGEVGTRPDSTGWRDT